MDGEEQEEEEDQMGDREEQGEDQDQVEETETETGAKLVSVLRKGTPHQSSGRQSRVTIQIGRVTIVPPQERHPSMVTRYTYLLVDTCGWLLELIPRWPWVAASGIRHLV